MLFVLLAAVFGVIGIWFGGLRGRPGAGFFLGLFLGPFGWLLAAVLPAEAPKPAWKQRGYAWRANRQQSQVASWLDSVDEAEPAAARKMPVASLPTATLEPRIVHCPHCRGAITDDGVWRGRHAACPHCRGQFVMPN